eukprot:Skav223528  [mRNA]  locus=scaffold1160:375469:376032:+ [translate_table: standard]
MRGAKPNTTAESSVRSFFPHMGCCNGCYTSFCSPQSGRCYDQKDKYYYLECAAGNQPFYPHANCCNSCSWSQYCSPQSGNCYDSKRKDYYLECYDISAPSGNFGSDIGDWQLFPEQTCTEPTESQVVWGLSSRTACKEKCEDRTQFPWCRSFEVTSVGPCGNTFYCKLMGDCMVTGPSNCDDVYILK